MKVFVKLTAWLLAMVALVLLPTPALALDLDDWDYDSPTPPELRVMLASGVYGHTIKVVSGEYLVVAANDRNHVYYTAATGEGITLSANDNCLALPADEDSSFRFNGQNYRGGFRVVSSGSNGYAVNYIDVESYLYGVVGRELGYGYNLDATQAQAVAARSYALASISSSNKYYDVTNTTASQVYGGLAAETEKIRHAVDATRGYVLSYDRQVVMAYFSSNAGGHTEDIDQVWVSDEVPIWGVPSPYDAYAGDYSGYGASTYSWTVEYTPQEMVQLANAYGDTDIGSYRSVEVSTSYQGQTSVSGRAMEVTVKGSRGSVSATKDSIRSLLNLKSTLFTITDVGGSQEIYVKGGDGQVSAWSKLTQLFATAGSGATTLNGSNDTFFVRTANGLEEISKEGSSSDKVVISGYGYGHGVGMSQWGAIAMGDQGYSWQEIIEHYYCSGGVELTAIYE